MRKPTKKDFMYKKITSFGPVAENVIVLGFDDGTHLQVWSDMKGHIPAVLVEEGPMDDQEDEDARRLAATIQAELEEAAIPNERKIQILVDFIEELEE